MGNCSSCSCECNKHDEPDRSIKDNHSYKTITDGSLLELSKSESL
jgi:hypothetical protein